MYQNNSYNMAPQKNKGALLIGIIFFSVFLIYLLVSGFLEYTDKSGTASAEIDIAGYGVELEHSIWGLIPTGKEYYYIAINGTNGNIYVVRAGKHWIEQNFDSSTHQSINGMMTLTAEIDGVDPDVAKELDSRITPFTECGFTCVTGSSSCYNIVYRHGGLNKLICAGLFITTIIVFMISKKLGGGTDFSPKLVIVGTILLFIAMLFMIYVISTEM